ncbi:MAG TPA: tetratricopeptide repeat protein [Albitalea sp.]|nr:tetratricopeptide repeat protein [Albitalea sp.]
MTTLSRTLCATALALTLHAAFAADTAVAPAAADPLAPARAQIAAQHWRAAIDELRRVNDTGSADWNNLMGYSLRKAKTPDLEGSEHFYDEALRIDPNHRGALEYSGELYLMKGDVAKAEQRLAALDKLCRLPCEEHTRLKKALAAYRANGGNYSSVY